MAKTRSSGDRVIWSALVSFAAACAVLTLFAPVLSAIYRLAGPWAPLSWAGSSQEPSIVCCSDQSAVRPMDPPPEDPAGVSVRKSALPKRRHLLQGLLAKHIAPTHVASSLTGHGPRVKTYSLEVWLISDLLLVYLLPAYRQLVDVL